MAAITTTIKEPKTFQAIQGEQKQLGKEKALENLNKNLLKLIEIVNQKSEKKSNEADRQIKRNQLELSKLQLKKAQLGLAREEQAFSNSSSRSYRNDGFGSSIGMSSSDRGKMGAVAVSALTGGALNPAVIKGLNDALHLNKLLAAPFKMMGGLKDMFSSSSSSSSRISGKSSSAIESSETNKLYAKLDEIIKAIKEKSGNKTQKGKKGSGAGNDLLKKLLLAALGGFLLGEFADELIDLGKKVAKKVLDKIWEFIQEHPVLAAVTAATVGSKLVKGKGEKAGSGKGSGKAKGKGSGAGKPKINEARETWLEKSKTWWNEKMKSWEDFKSRSNEWFNKKLENVKKWKAEKLKSWEEFKAKSSTFAKDKYNASREWMKEKFKSWEEFKAKSSKWLDQKLQKLREWKNEKFKAWEDFKSKSGKWIDQKIKTLREWKNEKIESWRKFWAEKTSSWKKFWQEKVKLRAQALKDKAVSTVKKGVNAVKNAGNKVVEKAKALKDKAVSTVKKGVKAVKNAGGKLIEGAKGFAESKILKPVGDIAKKGLKLVKGAGKVAGVAGLGLSIYESVEKGGELIKNPTKAVANSKAAISNSWNKLHDGKWEWSDVGDAAQIAFGWNDYATVAGDKIGDYAGDAAYAVSKFWDGLWGSNKQEKIINQERQKEIDKEIKRLTEERNAKMKSFIEGQQEANDYLKKIVEKEPVVPQTNVKPAPAPMPSSGINGYKI